MMSLKKDLKQTLLKNTSTSHIISDSDSDITLEPDPPDWETAIQGEVTAGSSGLKSTEKSLLNEKKLPHEGRITKHHSKTHDLSDSDEDLPKPKYGSKSHGLSDSDDDIEMSKLISSNEMPKLSNLKNDAKVFEQTNTKHSISDSDDEADGYCKPKVSKVNPQQKGGKAVDRHISVTHNMSESDDYDIADFFKPRVKTSPKHNFINSPMESQKLSPFSQNLKRKQTLMLDKEDSPSNKKPICKYGSRCYRKNSSHLKEFFHPSSPTKTEFQPSTSRPTEYDTTLSRMKTESSLGSKDQRSPKDIFEENQPISFFLTKAAGIKEKFNRSHAMNLKDILSPCMGTLVASCQFNYLFDLPWMLEQYPAEFRRKPLVIVHGAKGAVDASLQATARKLPNISFCKAKLPMTFGTHHTKMMFLLYEDGMRVVIHTSNMILQDWHQKTQGMWISPVFPKLSTPGVSIGDSPTKFKQDLLEYVNSYQAYQLKDWKDHICRHDMSSAKVFIIASSPGRHLAEKKSCFGHLKLRKVLREFGHKKEEMQGWPVIGQFSSIGNLGYAKDRWLCAEFLQSLATAKGTSNIPLASLKFNMIFPTVDDVRTSLEGYPAGASIPYSINVAKKQDYLHTMFHKWKSDGRGRSRAMPHIKTYGRPSPSDDKLAWYLVTSSNLSKAAWGALEKNCHQLMIRSYEIGVLFIPSLFNVKGNFAICRSADDIVDKKSLLLPYDLPLSPYQKGDKPWIWDIPHKELPDTNGNMWCPC